MLSKRRALVLVALTSSVLGCQPSATPVSQAEMDRAQETLAPFKEELVDALMGTLQDASRRRPFTFAESGRQKLPLV